MKHNKLWFEMIRRAYVAHDNLCDLEKEVGLQPGAWAYTPKDIETFYRHTERMQLSKLMFPRAEPDYATKFFTEMYARACWYRMGRPVFDLGPGFIHECVETSAGAATFEDIHWPFPVFMVHIDPQHSPLFSMLPSSALDGLTPGPLEYLLIGTGMRANVINDVDEIIGEAPVLHTFSYHTSEDVAATTTRLPDSPDEKIETFFKSHGPNKGINSARYTGGVGVSEELDNPMATRYTMLTLRIVMLTALRMSHMQKANAEKQEAVVRQGKIGNPIVFRFGHEVKLDEDRRTRVITFGRSTAEDALAEHALYVRGHAQRYHTGSGEGKSVEWRTKQAYRKGQGSTLERRFKVVGAPESPPSGNSNDT